MDLFIIFYLRYSRLAISTRTKQRARRSHRENICSVANCLRHEQRVRNQSVMQVTYCSNCFVYFCITTCFKIGALLTYQQLTLCACLRQYATDIFSLSILPARKNSPLGPCIIFFLRRYTQVSGNIFSAEGGKSFSSPDKDQFCDSRSSVPKAFVSENIVKHCVVCL